MKYAALFSDPVFAAYDDPSRHHHTRKHILAMLNSPVEWDSAQSLAILFHDIVYDPTSKTNEEASVEVARRYVPSHLRDEVIDIIMATKHHKRTGNHQIDLVLDADCSVMGSNPVTYDEYAKNIRLEYHMFDDETYRLGRVKFLESFSGFLTPEFKIYDTMAEINIHRELCKYDHHHGWHCMR